MDGKGISADPWEDAIQSQRREREDRMHKDMIDAQEAEYAEMGEVVRRNAMESAKRQMSFNNLLASAVKFSKGSALPEVVRNFMNRKMGWDGVKTGVLGGGYQADGGYAFEFANGVDGQGNVLRKTQSFAPSSLYNMMNLNRVAFDDADRSAMRQNLLSSGMSEKEVTAMDEAGRSYGRVADPQHISNMMGGGAGGREIGSGAVMKKVDRRPHAVRAYSNVQTPGRNAGGRVFGAEADGTPFAYELGEKKSEAENWRQFSVGAAEDGKTQVRGYRNEVTGEVAYVKDGELPPWRQGTQGRGLSLDDRLALEKAKTAGRMEVEGLKQTGRRELADISAALKRQGFEVDEKKLAEAIRHNKATEGASGAKSATAFNKTVYERMAATVDRLSMKEKLSEDEKAELARAKEIMADMEGYGQAERAPDDTDDILRGGDTQGGTKKPAPGAAGATGGAGTQTPPPAGGKKITGYRYNQDKTKRIQVYSDGTQGEVEDVPGAAKAEEVRSGVAGNTGAVKKPAPGAAGKPEKEAGPASAEEKYYGIEDKGEAKEQDFSVAYDEQRPRHRSVGDLQEDYTRIMTYMQNVRIPEGTRDAFSKAVRKLNLFNTKEMEARDQVAVRKLIDEMAKKYQVKPVWMDAKEKRKDIPEKPVEEKKENNHPKWMKNYLKKYYGIEDKGEARD